MCKVVISHPGGRLYLKDVDGWEGIKAEIGGNPFIEVVPLGEKLAAYIDENGKAKNLPINTCATNKAKMLLAALGRTLLPGDVLVGTVVFVGVKEGDDGLEEDDVSPDLLKECFPILDKTPA